MLPSPEDAVEKFLRAHKREAALLWRAPFASPLAARGVSYLGGFPKLPPNVEWPCVTIAGSRLALPFEAQICLSELPDFADRNELPREGTLFFFGLDDDGNPDSDGTLRSRVLFHPESAERFPTAQPAAPLAACFDAKECVRWLDTPRHGVGFRFDLDFTPFDSFPEDYGNGALEPSLELRRDPNFEAHVDALIARRMPKSLYNSPTWRDDERLVRAWASMCREVFEETREQLVLAELNRVLVNQGPTGRTIWPYEYYNLPPSAEWICAWGMVSSVAKAIITPRHEREELKVGDLGQRFLAQAEGWLTLARTHDPLSAPEDAVRVAVFDALKQYTAPARHGEVVEKGARQLKLRVFEVWGKIARHWTNALLEADLGDRVPEDMRAWLDYRGDVFEYGHPLHQVLGHGSLDHTFGPPSGSSLPLLKLDGWDDALPWAGGEGARQYWIERDALIGHRFCAATLRI